MSLLLEGKLPASGRWWLHQEGEAVLCWLKGPLRGTESSWTVFPSDEVRREAQGAFRVAPGNSGLHAHGKGERVIALEI